MKILFCLGDMSQGGAQRVVTNLSNFFVSKKNKVSIVVTKKEKSFYNVDKNVSFISLDENKNKNNLIFRTIKRVKKLHKIIKSENPDIILAFLPEPTFRILLANLFLKKKVIISVRNDPNVIYNTFLKKLIVKLLYNRANGFVFQTEDAKNWFSNKIQNKSVVISNPINEDFIVKPFKGNREKTIVNVARIAKQKRHDLLIDAFYEIHKKYPDWKLKIYGEGDRKSLVKKVNELKINESVLFMGKVVNIKDEIYKAGMFVLTSDFEGMPNALMEAMALGLPCISTDCPCGGPKSLIIHGNDGLLIPIGDKQALIDSITNLIENPNKAKLLGMNANKICDKLHPKIINQKWEDYILKIIERVKDE